MLTVLSAIGIRMGIGYMIWGAAQVIMARKRRG